MECLGQRLDAELRAVRSDESNLAGSDAVVDPRLVGRRRDYWCSLRGKGCPPGREWGYREARRPRTRSPPIAPNGTRGGAGSTSVDHGAPFDRMRSGGRVGPAPDGPLSEFSCPVRVTQVSSLWTPGGEHPVDPETETRRDRAPPGPRPRCRRPGEAEAAMRAEIDEVRRQLAQVPPEVVVANHAMGLYELAAIHLSQEPPNAPGRRPRDRRDGGARRRPRRATRRRRAHVARRPVPAAARVRAGHRFARLSTTFPPSTSTPSARSRRACSASCPGTRRPVEVTTRHHGQSASTVASRRPTARAATGVARFLRDLAVGHDVARAQPPQDCVDPILERCRHSDSGSAAPATGASSAGKSARTC